jgi:polyphosphate kinase
MYCSRRCEEDIIFLRRNEWTEQQQEWVRFFSNELMPILTPIGLDLSHPFPGC